MSANDLLSTHIRVVLAEDEIDMQHIVTDILKRAADIELVGIGENGQAAIVLCVETQPDILLLDLAMPVMDGFETANIVQEYFPKIKLLVLSSLGDHASIQAMLEKKNKRLCGQERAGTQTGKRYPRGVLWQYRIFAKGI